jgi:hypothetical protein
MTRDPQAPLCPTTTTTPGQPAGCTPPTFRPWPRSHITLTLPTCVLYSPCTRARHPAGRRRSHTDVTRLTPAATPVSSTCTLQLLLLLLLRMYIGCCTAHSSTRSWRPQHSQRTLNSDSREARTHKVTVSTQAQAPPTHHPQQCKQEHRHHPSIHDSFLAVTSVSRTGSHTTASLHSKATQQHTQLIAAASHGPNTDLRFNRTRLHTQQQQH